jgi:hypothetical protein
VSMPFTPTPVAAYTPSGTHDVMVQSALDVLSSEQFAALTDHITAHVAGSQANKLEAKQAEVSRLTGELIDQQRIVSVLRESMSVSDDHVRNAIVDWTSARGIDNSEVNDLLNELDLDPVEQEFTVQVRVMAYQYVDITVNAVDAEAAAQKVNDGDDDARRDVERELDGHDWEVEEYEVSDVTLA